MSYMEKYSEWLSYENLLPELKEELLDYMRNGKYVEDK